jgi:catechol 2,3-dioxygenase-like lactoylglutathione lyase family enzyme
MDSFSKGLHEIILVVKDVRRAARFYCDLLGLEPYSEITDDWAQLATISTDQKQWLGITKGPLLFEEFSPRPEGQRFGPIHFAFRGDARDLEGFVQNARRVGVKLLGPHRWNGRMEGTSYYFYDPDDNLGELWFPDPSESDKVR